EVLPPSSERGPAFPAAKALRDPPAPTPSCYPGSGNPCSSSLRLARTFKSSSRCVRAASYPPVRSLAAQSFGPEISVYVSDVRGVSTLSAVPQRVRERELWPPIRSRP